MFFFYNRVAGRSQARVQDIWLYGLGSTDWLMLQCHKKTKQSALG